MSSEDDDISLSDDDILEHTDNLELEGKVLGKYNILINDYILPNNTIIY